MEFPVCPLLFLILTVDYGSASFFISAPNVFHVGIKEKVFVQMGGPLLNRPVTLHLEHEGGSGMLMSERVTTQCNRNGQVQTVELMVDREKMSTLPPFRSPHPYLLLVAQSDSFAERKITRVLVSQHRGYIFIQTDQPIYNPTQKVRYRIFTLDHTMRPHEEIFEVMIFNAVGNRIKKSLKTAEGGILTETFDIPDVSEMGEWKIVAHYQGDEMNPATRVFKVEKFVLPSFEVVIKPEQSYLQLNMEQFSFNISALYSYGESISGAYHCRFGLLIQDSDGKMGRPVFVKGLELTGSIKDGSAFDVLQIAKLSRHLQDHLKKTLSDLEQSGTELYMAVSVTDIHSGELQEAEISLPIVSQRYTIDLSRTRSHYIPGVPLDVVVLVRHPNGSPAAEVPVAIREPFHHEDSTNQEGAVYAVFNVSPEGDITVEVTVDGQRERKVIRRALSSSNLYLSVTNKVYTVGTSLAVTYQPINGSPQDGFIYYMVFSRGMLLKQGSILSGISSTHQLQITPAMTPSFRLIGYYHNRNGDIIADSVWVDVKDECERKITVSSKRNKYYPGKKAILELNLHGQRAKVALLAVDKAIYALNADNKLTAKQVFSSMQSYDLGCSYGGGFDTASTLRDAGLSFLYQLKPIASTMRDAALSSPVVRVLAVFQANRAASDRQHMGTGFGCDSGSKRQRRSLDLEQEMLTLKSNYTSEDLQQCCARGLTLIPMSRTCEERAKRVSQLNTDPACTEAFFACCQEGERLRDKKRQEDAQTGLSRTASALDIERFFIDTTNQRIRRYFPSSFAFTVIDVSGEGSPIPTHTLSLPDSITTWEIQAVSLSAAHGFCVAEPYELKVSKEVFVSLRLPYSVKKHEQISIVPVIYNYGEESVQVAVHMEQTEGLCSPGSATSTAFVNITLEPRSTQSVTFSAVPMTAIPIPIKIRLFDIERDDGIDAVQKMLNVRTEGLEERVEQTLVVKVDGLGRTTFTIDGELPDNTVPESISNIFISMEEGQVFSPSTAQNLLSPEGVAALLKLPYGCAEQTMKLMAPTAIALRYLDLNQRWFELPPGTRDVALHSTEEGYIRILTFKKEDGSYGAWTHRPSSYWLTGLVVKVLSLVAERQLEVRAEQGRQAIVINDEEIRHSARYLLSVQNDDGSFADPHPVIHRDMQGGIGGREEDVSMTAFITVALNRSLQFLNEGERSDAEASISRSTTYLISRFEELERPFAVAIAAYCLSVCLTDKTQTLPAWKKLQTLATQAGDGCRMWNADAEALSQEKVQSWRTRPPNADAITVETTAYALLTAVAHGDFEWANSAACWLSSQENYGGGFRSTQDTIVALEALAEYALKRPSTPPKAQIEARFTVPGRRDITKLSLENSKEKVETELKRMVGKNITVQLTGRGEAKMKVVKAYHLLEPRDNCDLLSINVRVEGKVKYTARVVENYNEDYDEDYGDAGDENMDVPRSAIEWFDARTRRRRDTDHSLKSQNAVNYEVCVRHSLSRNLTGMAIADITLLSGFEAQTEDLDNLKELPEQYISHYEVSYGKVLLYFNEIEQELCIEFGAIQKVPIGLLQPAPAAFYDYYEPNRKCTVFYSAPRRSKMVSKLCSEDVCQCAERPCHKEKSIFEDKKITVEDRVQHACFYPRVDYGYIVEVVNMSMKLNFELYTTNVMDVLRANGDSKVDTNVLRVFAKRLQCKGKLETGKQYLIMGKDGSTKDSNGQMRYLLESNTWIEPKPGVIKCERSIYRAACKKFNDFVSDYKINGCRQ